MDEIKRKLELIDRQLTPRRLHARVVSTCPLVFVAVGLCAGILAQNSLGVSVSIWLGLLVLFAAAAPLVFVVQQFYGFRLQYVTAYLALGCFACLGAIRLSDYNTPTSNDIRLSVGEQRKLATIRGLIVTEPYINRHEDWKFARFRPTDPGASFYLKIEQVQTAGGWADVQGTIRVQVDEPVFDLQAGDRIEAYCWLERFSPPTNPGQFDTAAYMARKNVFVAASVRSRGAIELLERPPHEVWARLRAKPARFAATALLGDMDQEDPAKGLLQALLLGDRRQIDGDTYSAFRKTGLLHFISLSGMHLGILFGIIWWVSRIAGFMKPFRAVICAIAVGVFLLVVPPRAPTLRAAVICWMFCASLLVRRYYNPVNTLSLAAVILLLFKPTELFEAGWQLSFASVLGLLVFCESLHLFLHEKITGLRQPDKDKKTLVSFRMAPRPGPYLLRLLSAGLTAWLGGAGILLYHFHTIDFLTSVWTVLVFPFVSAILILGFLKILLFFLLPTLSGLLGFVTAMLSGWLVWIVGLIAKLNVSQIIIGHVSILPILAYYCAVAFAAYTHFRRPLVKRLICAAMFLSLFAYLGAVKFHRTHRDDLTLTCLDVGHGQAILARLPGGRNVLFDAGSLHGSNVGARVVVPFLNYEGTGRIDAVVISHNDTDHINGILEIVASCSVGGVYANDAFFGRVDEWGTVEFLKKCLGEQGFEIEPLQDHIASGGATIRTLWPDKGKRDTSDLTDNDRSLVSLIEFAGARILLCSDIEQFAQAELLRLHPDLKADVVVVPHHGSAATLNPEFLSRLNARVNIVSCDRTQYERARSAACPAGAAAGKMQTFYTARDGAVTVTVGKNGKVNTERFAD